MALPVNGSTHFIPALLLNYRSRKNERLSWPSWLTCSGRFTHISGHPSAAGRAQDRESSPARDRRSTTVPRHQPAGQWTVCLCVQPRRKTRVLLMQCCSDNGPRLSAALNHLEARSSAPAPAPAAASGGGDAASNDRAGNDAAAAAAAAAAALGQLAVIVEHVVFELTDIMVRTTQSLYE